jgi:hypothetical protein
VQSWSAVACHRFGRAEQAGHDSHPFSQATVLDVAKAVAGATGKRERGLLVLACQSHFTIQTSWMGSLRLLYSHLRLTTMRFGLVIHFDAEFINLRPFGR